MKKTSSGFTIVELLIVIVVIGILAALVVVAYTGIQSQAQISAVKESLAQAKKKLAVWEVNNGSFPLTAAWSSVGISDGGTTYQYTSNGTSYCLTATNGSTSYYLNTTTETSPTNGGCPGHGQGGQGAITNINTNPSLESNSANWGPNWGASGAGTASRMSSGGQCGNAYFRATWSTAPTSSWSGLGTGYFPVQVGKSYSSSVWIRSSTAQSYRIIMRTNTFPTNPDQLGPTVNLSPNTWTKLNATYNNVPSGVTSMSAFPDRTGSGTAQVGDVLDGDCAILVEGTSVPNFADGNSLNWIWNGTLNNSTSTGPPL